MENTKIELVRLFKKVTDFTSKKADDPDRKDLKDLINYIGIEKDKYENKVVNVVFAGEIKTGKSSLINSLLGEDICTVDSGVCTNTNMIIKYGDTEKITVYLYGEDDETINEVILNSRAEIDEYVSEKSNKNNKKKVHIIEVTTPNEVLKSGLVFIDTPGLGSLNPYHAATTFSIAPQADVFFMVSSADSELTLEEKSYMEQLIDCSECKNIVHVVTNSDNGYPDVILERNNLYFNQIVKEKSINYYSCKVSNINFGKYLRGEIKNLSATGFDNLKEIIDTLQTNIDTIIAKRALEFILSVICQFEQENSMLLTASEDPTIAEKKKDELQNVIDRLEEIKKNRKEWEIDLSSKIHILTNLTNKKITDSFDYILHTLKTKLMIDEYIKHPDKLGTIASAEIVKSNNNLQKYLNDQLTNVYYSLCEETGLSLVKLDEQEIDKNEKKVQVGDANVDAMAIYRSSILSRSFTYSIIGTAVGATVGGTVGAIIGTWFVPGFGTLAGAKIGAAFVGAISYVWGGIKGFFFGKEKVKQAKRDKIISKITPELKSIEGDVTFKTSNILIEATGQLRKLFDKELNNEIAKYNKLKADLEKIISRNVSIRNELTADTIKLKNMRLNAENLQTKLK